MDGIWSGLAMSSKASDYAKEHLSLFGISRVWVTLKRQDSSHSASFGKNLEIRFLTVGCSGVLNLEKHSLSVRCYIL